jgi:RNA polymerase sigma-70 factor (ECF subfamily)
MATTDLTLILRAQQGERDALDELLRQHQERLYRYIAGVVGTAATAEDVLQETFLRIARKLRWLSEPAYFRAWSFRIASREAFRALRALRPNVPLEDLDESRLPVDAPSLSRAELDELRETVTALSPGSRAVIQLHYFEELSLDEAALALDIPLGTVKSRLAYGLEQLRRTYRKRQ